jgi:hypothetical protein
MAGTYPEIRLFKGLANLCIVDISRDLVLTIYLFFRSVPLSVVNFRISSSPIREQTIA